MRVQNFFWIDLINLSKFNLNAGLYVTFDSMFVYLYLRRFLLAGSMIGGLIGSVLAALILVLQLRTEIIVSSFVLMECTGFILGALVGATVSAATFAVAYFYGRWFDRSRVRIMQKKSALESNYRLSPKFSQHKESISSSSNPLLTLLRSFCVILLPAFAAWKVFYSRPSESSSSCANTELSMD